MNLSLNKVNILKFAGLFYTFSIAYSSSSGASLVKFSRVFLFVAFVIDILWHFGRLRKPPKEYTYWLLAFLGVCVLSVFWGLSKPLVISSVFTQLYIVVTNIILLCIFVKDKDYIFSLMKISIIASIAHGLNIFLRHGPLVYLASRGNDITENANILAYVASVAVVFGHIIISQKRTKNIFTYQFFTAINAIFALLTASKKVFIFIGVYGAICFIFKAKNPLKVIRNIFIAFFACIAVYFLIMRIGFLYSLVGYRIETMVAGFLGLETDGSTGFRLSLIQWGLDWFSQKPILGHGLNCYKYLLGSTYDTWVGASGVYAHNNYIELMVDIGIVGTIIYYYIYISMVVKSIKLRKYSELAIYAGAIVMMLLVAEYGQITYSIPFLQEVILIAWFILYQQSRRYSKN